MSLGRNVPERWSAASTDYVVAAQERKCYHVHRLQNKIIADVDWLHWSNLTVSRNPRQHRGLSTRMKKKVRDAKDRLRQTISRLHVWQAVLGDIGPVVYDAADLRLEDLQQASWRGPWQHSGEFVSVQHQELECLQHLKPPLQ